MPISPSNTQGYRFGSKAEKKIYHKALKEGIFLHQDRYLFHSLSIVETGNEKIKAEIDFVYMDAECILFLEVKGGEIRYDSSVNQWYLMGGTEKGDPFRQAYQGLYQTRDTHLVRLFSGKGVRNRLAFGIGVIFPESISPPEFVRREVAAMEYDPALIYDYNEYKNQGSFAKYITRLKSYWQSHRQFSGREGISRKELSAVAAYFRKDLHFTLPVSDLIDRSGSDVIHFTSFQMYALETVEANPGRGGLITGGPGTGKTALALELLTRSLLRGKRTLMVCFNKNLAFHLNSQVNNPYPQGDYMICNLHALLRDNDFLVQPSPNGNGEEYWERTLPLFFARNIKADKVGHYDYLIVDEGQDIMNEYQIEALGKLVKGDLEGGNWTIFLDKEFQKIYNPDPEYYFQYLREAYSTILIPLVLNCRNTLSIISSASFQTGLPAMPCMRTESDWDSIVRTYSSEKDCLVQVRTKIKEFQVKSIPAEDITILCTERGQVTDFLSELGDRLIDSAQRHPGKTCISTIHAYKGLENKFILIIGPAHYDNSIRQQMQLLYTANTRATCQSILYLSKKYEPLLSKNIRL